MRGRIYVSAPMTFQGKAGICSNHHQQLEIVIVMIETDRLVLRRWRIEDAEALYKYASDERVSELALWPRHTSLEMSREVIEKFFIPNPQSFAMVLRTTDEPAGCIGLVPEGEEHHPSEPLEREVGYWIGHPYWSKGLTT